MKPKPPKIVKAPAGNIPKYLTPNKEYKVTGIWDDWDRFYGYGFYILDDEGDQIKMVENEATHLNNQDWIIIEREQ